MSRILIIEDEESIASLEKDYLELSGFEVDIETDGNKGLDKALNRDYDLFILDLMLPGMDGFDICREIRERLDTPILMVSAKKDDIDKIRGLGLGADDKCPQERRHQNPWHQNRQDRAARVGQRGRDAVHDEGVRLAHLPGGESEPCVLEGRAVP